MENWKFVRTCTCSVAELYVDEESSKFPRCCSASDRFFLILIKPFFPYKCVTGVIQNDDKSLGNKSKMNLVNECTLRTKTARFFLILITMTYLHFSVGTLPLLHLHLGATSHLKVINDTHFKKYIISSTCTGQH